MSNNELSCHHTMGSNSLAGSNTQPWQKRQPQAGSHGGNFLKMCGTAFTSHGSKRNSSPSQHSYNCILRRALIAQELRGVKS
eukprot:38613-Chlamydomonas_euryale.AAC.3